MRVSVDQDTRVGAELHQQPEYPAYVAPLGAARIQFAVAIGARTTFAKAIIAFRVDHTVLVQGGKVSAPGSDILSSLQDDGPDPFFDEAKCREQTGRTRSDDQHLSVGCRYIGEMHRFHRFFSRGLADESL